MAASAIGFTADPSSRAVRRTGPQRVGDKEAPYTSHRQESRRRESHPPALAEPGVNLSAHRAPIVQPSGRTPQRQWANRPGWRREWSAMNPRALVLWRRMRLIGPKLLDQACGSADRSSGQISAIVRTTWQQRSNASRLHT